MPGSGSIYHRPFSHITSFPESLCECVRASEWMRQRDCDRHETVPLKLAGDSQPENVPASALLFMGLAVEVGGVGSRRGRPR